MSLSSANVFKSFYLLLQDKLSKKFLRAVPNTLNNFPIINLSRKVIYFDFQKVHHHGTDPVEGIADQIQLSYIILI